MTDQLKPSRLKLGPAGANLECSALSELCGRDLSRRQRGFKRWLTACRGLARGERKPDRDAASLTSLTGLMTMDGPFPALKRCAILGRP